jgi:hypothetical protein
MANASEAWMFAICSIILPTGGHCISWPRRLGDKPRK